MCWRRKTVCITLKKYISNTCVCSTKLSVMSRKPSHSVEKLYIRAKNISELFYITSFQPKKKLVSATYNFPFVSFPQYFKST